MLGLVGEDNIKIIIALQDSTVKSVKESEKSNPVPQRRRQMNTSGCWSISLSILEEKEDQKCVQQRK